MVGGLVIGGHQQQNRASTLFQNSVFQLGDFAGAIVFVGEDLRGYVKIKGVECGFGGRFIGEGEQSQLFAGGTGGTVGGCGGELFGLQTGHVQSVQHPDEFCVQRFQRLGKDVRLQKCLGQALRKGKFALLRGAGGQGQNQTEHQRQGQQSLHGLEPPFLVVRGSKGRRS